ncbi:hypothetical protein KJ684_02205 [Patescibacteria group bacterium]|nr:hypothetical protein [Patescibacteria group bacterium]
MTDASRDPWIPTKEEWKKARSMLMGVDQKVVKKAEASILSGVDENKVKISKEKQRLIKERVKKAIEN